VQLFLSLIIALIAGTFLVASPCRAQDSSKLPDQATVKLVEGNVFGETEHFLRRHLVDSPKPEYPSAALEAKIQGQVLVFVWFDKDGRLIEAKPLISPNELLSNAVVNALKVWRIKPKADMPLLSELRFIFSLDGNDARVSEAPEAEQQKVSEEFKKEIARRRKPPE
jgi:TonB family protein